MFDWSFAYPSQKMPTLAGCMVCTSQPLAAQAGLQALRAGGNAVDAALAAAIALTVVEPVMNGIGGDTLALVWDGNTLHGLNGSGRAPAGWDAARFAGRRAMPDSGWDSVTVPGTVAAWADLSERFGRLPFSALFEAGIHYAEDGFLVSPTVARQWEIQSQRVRDQPGFAEAFLPGGAVPRAGARFRLPVQAGTLRRIADSKGAEFYRGELAARVTAHGRDHGSAMTLEDLGAHRSEWVKPVKGAYRGLQVHQLPPNAQGIAVLIALGILEHLDLHSRAYATGERIHLQVEAMRLAFDDVYANLADPSAMRADWRGLTDPSRLERQARGIEPTRARQQATPVPAEGGTVYVASGDGSGMMVSLIQSNYRGFGSGIVVPGTGISLHNRAAGFSLDPAHPNAVGAGKRPFHTIIPAMLSRDDELVAALGVVGANMQPQGQMQVISNIEDFGMNPQSALDAPRWRIRDDGKLMLEHTLRDMAADLSERGHDVLVCKRGDLEFGGAQVLHVLDGGYVGASDPRRDGIACGV